MNLQGVLLINQGTPGGPDTGSVRKYLRQFLSDPRIMDIPTLLRWFLLYGIILPFRPARSARLYQKIWTPTGSPLMNHTIDLAEKTSSLLGEKYLVKPAMRYGSPGLEETIDELLEAGVTGITVFPLFPQYASSTTGSILEEVFRILAKKINIPSIYTIAPFYDHPLYIESLAQVGRSYLETEYDHVLFTYHGLPEKHLLKANQPKAHCLQKENCCKSINKQNRFCYRAHCFATTRLVAEKMGIDKKKYSISFQSRMGRHPWIKPYTDEVLKSLPAEGVKKLIVFCPSFIADCLETLEEIAIQGKETFLAAGGDSFVMVPALNSENFWCETVSKMVSRDFA